MLTATELADMQTVEESVMSSSAVIVRFGTASDGMGGFTETWAAVGTVDCDLWPINRNVREQPTDGGQIISRADWYITMPFDADVTAKDRVTIDSRTFEILFVPNDESWATAKRVEAISYNEELRV